MQNNCHENNILFSNQFVFGCFQAFKAKERERREVGKTLVDQKRKREEDAMIKAAAERRKDKV